MSGRFPIDANRAHDESVMAARKKLILWTGERHSGKTTSAAKLVRRARNEGYNVAGLLAQALYHDGRLVGFDAVDLRSKRRAPLARRNSNANKVGSFDFIAEGLKLGNAALSLAATESADLIIVDEFGPLELNSEGWRKSVDLLFRSSSAVILLIVRRELARQVQRLYTDAPSVEFGAVEPESVDQVLSRLRDRNRNLREVQ